MTENSAPEILKKEFEKNGEQEEKSAIEKSTTAKRNFVIRGVKLNDKQQKIQRIMG